MMDKVLQALENIPFLSLNTVPHPAHRVQTFHHGKLAADPLPAGFWGVGVFLGWGILLFPCMRLSQSRPRIGQEGETTDTIN